MKKNKNFWLGIVAAAALAAMGCADDENGGQGGSGGSGGSGGAGEMMGFVTVAHLAFDLPAAGATAVDVYVDDATMPAVDDLEYGEKQGPLSLPPGSYKLTITAGDDQTNELLVVDPYVVADGDDNVVVAHRTGDAAAPLGAWVFDNTGDGLAATDARVNVGHGADDNTIDPVNVFTATLDGGGAVDACTAFIDALELGQQTPRPAPATDPEDIAAGTVYLALDPGDAAACEAANTPVGPVALAAGSTYVVVAVDEDTGNANDTDQDLELWAIIDGGDPVGLITP